MYVIPRISGSMVFEVINSNPNGDPDAAGMPRQIDDLGHVSAVSVKKKCRKLIHFKDGPLWHEVLNKLNLEHKRFDIMERPDMDRKKIYSMSPEEVWGSCVDNRLFGSTFLENKGGEKTSDDPKDKKKGKPKNDDKAKRDRYKITGCIYMNEAFSVGPIQVEIFTQTKELAVKEDQSRGMAPGRSFVRHGIYVMNFGVGWSGDNHDQADLVDLEVFFRVLPFVYDLNRSSARPHVALRHVWAAVHKSSLGSFSETDFWDAMRPRVKDGVEMPASIDDYIIPQDIPGRFAEKAFVAKDLMSDPTSGLGLPELPELMGK